MASELKSETSPIFVVGATGVGKSAAGMEVARACGGAILCMDAMQVYRGSDIGTSKPSVAEREEILHGGLDLVDLGAGFDVAQYLRHAEGFLNEQRSVGRRVIIVGGTGLYFRALTRGLCEAPQGSDKLRVELSELSVADLQARLKKVDPGMFERIDVANPRRLARAIEVMEASGKSLRSWQEETPEPLVKDFTAIWICREKGELERRIAARVEAMFAQGWVEEVRGLVERYGEAAVRGFAGIGYREILEAGGKHYGITKFSKLTELGGGVGGQKWEAVKRDVLVATRQYAKRQLTWFAREPNLQKVMLTGTQSIFAAMPALL
jgi:tRNA dimethylallyltransferase